ncbi:MAG TPA: hypothetical protein VEH30_10770 [Terriglobales bacterium]|nr:hypothetical protein [Terriglobales bacterium]
MKSNSRSKTLLVILLSATLLATGCSAHWIKVALADLPVLLQMALNIGSLATTLQSGKQLSATDAAAIQNISNQASRDLNLLQTLYNEYEASPSATTIQEIQNAIADINNNLPALLQAAHVADPVLSARVTAAVNLILTTVNSFAALIPHSAASASVQRVTRKAVTVPRPGDLKKQWNLQVCGPSGKAELDSARLSCAVR